MRLAGGLVVCLVAVVLTATAAGAARADTAATDQTATTDAAQATGGAAAAAATGATDPSAVTESTDTTASTAPDTSTATSTAPDTSTAASTDVEAAIPVAQSIDRGCVFGSVVLLLPDHAPLVIGPVADAPSAPVAAASSLVYPADGSVVTASGVALEGTGCTAGQPAGGRSELHSLSLFDGAVTAEVVGLTIGDAGARHADAISGLAVDGNAVQAPVGAKVPVGNWGYLVTGTLERIRTTAASGTPQPPLRVQASALAVHLLEGHAGLPAGTVLLVSFAGVPGPTPPAPPAPAPPPAETPMQLRPASPAKVTPLPQKTATTAEKHQHHKKKQRKGPHHAPFKITPPLGTSHYVFPVTGDSSFVDTYGGFRSDVAGNWHHGDDIFADLGTPVVAVADGTVNRVGWQRIGGWRIWVVDESGNRFYYAHLSGYTPAVIHSETVKAGEVIGFVGNSGDAFTTSPHLHFEIHPQGLSRFGYDGAVDPTRYLQSWSHLQHVHAPRPAHPRLPKAPAARKEARYVFRELLAARGLLHKPARRPAPATPSSEPTGTTLPPADRAAAIIAATPPLPAAPRQTPQEPAATTTALAISGSLVVLLALSGSTLAVRRRKRKSVVRAAVNVYEPALVVPPPVSAGTTAPRRQPQRPRNGTARTTPRGPSPSVIMGTGSLALVTMSVVLLRRRGARRRTDV